VEFEAESLELLKLL